MLIVALALALALLLVGGFALLVVSDFLVGRAVVELLCRPGFWLRRRAGAPAGDEALYSFFSLLLGALLWVSLLLAVRVAWLH